LAFRFFIGDSFLPMKLNKERKGKLKNIFYKRVRRTTGRYFQHQTPNNKHQTTNHKQQTTVLIHLH